MSTRANWRAARVAAAVVLSVLAAAAPASAHSSSSTGGASYETPDVAAVTCGGQADAVAGCAPGASLRVSGENLRSTRAVVFLGGRGRADDRRARPSKASPHRVVVRIPGAAHSGRVRVIAAESSVTGPKVKVTAPAERAPAATSDGGVFPIQGTHRYGTAANHFGGGRGHQGEDVFAGCGTRLVAALSGTVTLAKWQDRAGNYVVIKAADGTSQVYMHMLEPATVAKGDTVTAGQPIGQVGQTGRADGCHLHFELWTAPGWYEGGEAIDPLPALKGWDTAS